MSSTSRRKQSLICQQAPLFNLTWAKFEMLYEFDICGALAFMEYAESHDSRLACPRLTPIVYGYVSTTGRVRMLMSTDPAFGWGCTLGTKVISAESSGCSAWTRTGKITAILSHETEKKCFLMVEIK